MNRIELLVGFTWEANSCKRVKQETKDKPTVLALREIEAGLIDASILTEEYAMEEELNAQEKLADEAKMNEVNEELSQAKLDSEVESDNLEVKEEEE